MAFTIAFCNQKGGAGKTTTASAFASYLSDKGKKTLIVDLDSQGSLTFLHNPDQDILKGSFEIISAKKPEDISQECITHLDSIDLIAANSNLILADSLLSGEVARESKLARALEPLQSLYDYILIDTAPSCSILMFNALAAADHVIIPTNSNVLHAKGMLELFDTCDLVQSRVNEKLQIGGILITMFRQVNIQSSTFEILENLAYSKGVYLIKNKVRLSSVVENCQSEGIPLFNYKRRSSTAVIKDYEAAIDEYLAHWHLR